MNNQPHTLPDIIVLFGSIGAGKGTQMSKLQAAFGGNIIDNGASFRAFAELRNNPDSPDQERALRVYTDMNIHNGPIKTEDMFYILEKRITDVLEEKSLVIMDKPGGILKEEMEWFFTLLHEKGKSISFIDLNITQDEAVRRITQRYFIPGSTKAYTSYEEALEEATNGQIPYKRDDDANADLVRERYGSMYQHLLPDLKSTCSRFGITIHTIDATGSIDDVFEKIMYTITDSRNHSYPCKK